MNKPTKDQIKKASDEKLAEWSAVFVMGWHKEAHGFVSQPYFAWHDENNKRIINCSEWNPAQNIGQAFELLDKVKDNQEIFNKFPDCLLKILDIRTAGSPWPSIIDSLLWLINARAITKAALMAKLGV